VSGRQGVIIVRFKVFIYVLGSIFCVLMFCFPQMCSESELQRSMEHDGREAWPSYIMYKGISMFMFFISYISPTNVSISVPESVGMLHSISLSRHHKQIRSIWVQMDGPMFAWTISLSFRVHVKFGYVSQLVQ